MKAPRSSATLLVIGVKRFLVRLRLILRITDLERNLQDIFIFGAPNSFFTLRYWPLGLGSLPLRLCSISSISLTRYPLSPPFKLVCLTAPAYTSIPPLHIFEPPSQIISIHPLLPAPTHMALCTSLLLLPCRDCRC